MRTRIFLTAFLMSGFAFGQTTGTNPTPLLNTGLPNPYPTPPPLLQGVTSTNPSLYAPYGGALSLIWPASLPTHPDFEPAPYAIPTVVNGICVRAGIWPLLAVRR